jgi:hypothetical protein
MKIKLAFIAIGLALLPFLGHAQTTHQTLVEDLNKATEKLTDEQLARLVNYAAKLQEEPKKNHKKKAKTNSNAAVVWRKAKYNLDVIKKGTVLFLPFQYVNITEIPYNIDNIISNCGCVSVTKPDKPLLKNESNTLMLSIDTNKLNGESSITVLIYDNSERSKSYLFINLDVQESTTTKN